MRGFVVQAQYYIIPINNPKLGPDKIDLHSAYYPIGCDTVCEGGTTCKKVAPVGLTELAYATPIASDHASKLVAQEHFRWRLGPWTSGISGRFSVVEMVWGQYATSMASVPRRG